MPAVGARHFVVLDAMRGIAALLVFLFHIKAHGGQLGIAPRGYLAVDFFFLLSGFVIGAAYETRLSSRGSGGLSIARFLTLRIARLYPTLLIGLLCGLTVTLQGRGNSPFTVILLINFLIVPMFGGHLLFPLNGVIWSLFFEIGANIGHAVALPFLTTRRLAAITCMCGLALIYATSRSGHANLGYGAPSPLSFAFAAGCVRIGWSYGLGLTVYRLLRDGALRPPSLPGWLAPLLLAGAVLMPASGPISDLLAIGLAFPIALLAGLGAKPAGRGRHLAIWLGSVSYPLYAIHEPLLFAARSLREGGALSWTSASAYWALTGLFIIICAALLENRYDAPIRSLLSRRRGRREGQPVLV